MDMFWFNLFWVLAFPFIYGLLISRLFGLKKPIDHWILFCLHMTATLLAVGVYALVITFTRTPILSLVFAFVLLTAVEGLVWQFFLKDRKLNGFLISHICCSVYVTPHIIGALLDFF